MVKIRVTGKTTFDWLEAKAYRGYPNSCAIQSTFSEDCFEKGTNVERNKYDVVLAAHFDHGNKGVNCFGSIYC